MGVETESTRQVSAAEGRLRAGTVVLGRDQDRIFTKRSLVRGGHRMLEGPEAALSLRKTCKHVKWVRFTPSSVKASLLHANMVQVEGVVQPLMKLSISYL